jgi:hypothetical protein
VKQLYNLLKENNRGKIRLWYLDTWGPHNLAEMEMGSTTFSKQKRHRNSMNAHLSHLFRRTAENFLRTGKWFMKMGKHLSSQTSALNYSIMLSRSIILKCKLVLIRLLKKWSLSVQKNSLLSSLLFIKHLSHNPKLIRKVDKSLILLQDYI